MPQGRFSVGIHASVGACVRVVGEGGMCQGTCVEVNEQLTGIRSLLLPRGSGK